MLKRIIQWSASNILLVLLFTAAAVFGGAARGRRSRRFLTSPTCR